MPFARPGRESIPLRGSRMVHPGALTLRLGVLALRLDLCQVLLFSQTEACRTSWGIPKDTDILGSSRITVMKTLLISRHLSSRCYSTYAPLLS